MLTTKDQIEHELSLLKSEQREGIKAAYYKYHEGIHDLLARLEMADLELCGEDEDRSELLDLHLTICQALAVLKPVETLGAIL